MSSFEMKHTVEAHPDTSTPDPHQDIFSKTVLGFWMYLMTDCLLFGTFFATYAVLYEGTYGGPTSKDIFDLTTAFIETMLLLTSSVTSGLAMLAAVKNKKNQAVGWLLATFLLGITFIFFEYREFHHLILEGSSWTRSAFLSSFFALVGLHGLHVSCGLIWLVVMILQLVFMGINTDTFRRMVLFTMFWHFLDLVWIFIFTFVYLIGVI